LKIKKVILRNMAEVVVVLPEGIHGNERSFYIVSEKDEKLVMEVHKADPKPGAHVVVEKRREGLEPHQLWYVDEQGLIRSKLNHFAMEAHDNKEKVHTKPFSGDARQQWIIKENRIVNKLFCDECLAIKTRPIRRDDDDIIAMPYEGKPHQHWKIDFV
jgi:hypothetical protein